MGKLFCQNKSCNKELSHYDTWRLPHMENVDDNHRKLSVVCKKCYNDFEQSDSDNDWIKNKIITQKQIKMIKYRKKKLNRINKYLNF